MKTFSLKKGEIEKKWLLLDAQGMVLGRFASQIAMILMGKNKPSYTPHMDCGDNVVIVNAEKIVLTGQKMANKVYYRHTGYPGGIKSQTAKNIITGKFPARLIEMAVKRMLPKGPLGYQQFKNMRVYCGLNHPHEAQNPVVVDLKSRNSKNSVR